MAACYPFLALLISQLNLVNPEAAEHYLLHLGYDYVTLKLHLSLEFVALTSIQFYDNSL